MLKHKLTEEELSFIEQWHNPKCVIESLCPNFDNLSSFKSNRNDKLHLYQIPMISKESMINFEATAKLHNLDEKGKFKLKKNVGEIYNVGARAYGKTLCSLRLDILHSLLHEEELNSTIFSIDEKRIRGVLNPVKRACEFHPIIKDWEVGCRFKPSIEMESKKTGWRILGINLTIKGKSPGEQWYQVHCDKTWGEEVSFESDDIYKKRRESEGKYGTINRLAGMTNFTLHSPMGKVFKDSKKKKFVLNLPRYVSPYWDSEQRENAEKDYGGKKTSKYKIFVEGEIIKDAETEIDMEMIEPCWNRKTEIKRFEIDKKDFKRFRDLIVVERPKCDRLFISADIGETSGTDINIFAEKGERYKWLYNIIIYDRKLEHQEEIFKYLAEELEANVIALDNGEGFGRVLSDHLIEKYGNERVLKYDGNVKVKVGYQKDNKGRPKVDKKGKLVYREERMREWGVSRIKTLLYGGRLLLPKDYKLENQLTYVVSRMSGNRKIYECFSDTGDHLFDSLVIFGVSQWYFGDFNKTKPIKKKKARGISTIF